MSDDYVRAPIVRIVDRGESTTVIGPKGARVFDGDSAAIVRAVLELHARPIARATLVDELSERAGARVPDAIVDQVMALLIGDGAVMPVSAPVVTTAPSRRVVLAITGAVAAVDAPALVRGLQAMGCDVRVALSRTAKQFVAIAALQALTHHQVWSGIWQRDARTPVPHINLAEWAELVVVCPATATTLSRITTGDCSDLVSAIVTATRAPVVIVPSMNDAMYASPAVQHNLETLRAHGRWIVHPAMGHEVAHRPGDRRSMIGPAPPAAAVLDIVRHVLAQAPHVPADAAGWERLWSSTPNAQLPWHTEDIDGALAAALDRIAGRIAQPARLLDIGTGAGTVAIAAARRGFAVTATDLSPSALARARERAGALPILFALDDITATRLDATYDVAVDVGVLHCLPKTAWSAYATSVTAHASALLLVAHAPGADRGTTPITERDVRDMFPGFALERASPTTLSHAPATLFELGHV